jgi:hypothetical protein
VKKGRGREGVNSWLALTLYLEFLIKSSVSQKVVRNFFGIIINLDIFLIQPKANVNSFPLLSIPFLIVLEPVSLSLEASMVVSPGQKKGKHMCQTKKPHFNT